MRNKRRPGARAHQRGLGDAAENWLRENDPEYETQKRAWQTPATDALARPCVPFEFQNETTNDDGEEIVNMGHEHLRYATTLYDCRSYDYDPVKGGDLHELERSIMPMARALLADGLSKRAVARLVGVEWRTFRRWLGRETPTSYEETNADGD